MRRPELTIKQILAWADVHKERTAQWPMINDRLLWRGIDEKWRNIDQALRKGLRGLHRGQTLACLLAKHRGKRHRKQLPPLAVRQILHWSDTHRARTGTWPRSFDGPIANGSGETWWTVDLALRNGKRGLRGGSSLARLLAAERGVPNHADPPRLSVRQILRWVDHHYRQTGNWPSADSGPVVGATWDTWLAIDLALRRARRGLRTRSSLAKLLAQHRRVERYVRKPVLKPAAILKWADAHFARTGKWPRVASGPIRESPGETWQRIHNALLEGKRGLPGGETLTHFIASRRKLRTKVTLPEITKDQVLKWLRAFHRNHGYWPSRKSGPIPTSRGETWSAVDSALKDGRRGFPGRSSLSRFIRRHFRIPTGKLVRPKRVVRPSSR